MEKYMNKEFVENVRGTPAPTLKSKLVFRRWSVATFRSTSEAMSAREYLFSKRCFPGKK